jgi:hypothetical protein
MYIIGFAADKHTTDGELFRASGWPKNRADQFAGFGRYTDRLVSGHQPPVRVQISTSVSEVVMLNQSIAAVPDLAFFQLLPHVGQRVPFQVLVHRPKFQRSQLDRTLLVSPTFSNDTSGVARLVLIFSTSSSASGNNPSRCKLDNHAVVFGMRTPRNRVTRKSQTRGNRGMTPI